MLVNPIEFHIVPPYIQHTICMLRYKIVVNYTTPNTPLFVSVDDYVDDDMISV